MGKKHEDLGTNHEPYADEASIVSNLKLKSTESYGGEDYPAGDEESDREEQ